MSQRAWGGSQEQSVFCVRCRYLIFLGIWFVKVIEMIEIYFRVDIWVRVQLRGQLSVIVEFEVNFVFIVVTCSLYGQTGVIMGVVVFIEICFLGSEFCQYCRDSLKDGFQGIFGFIGFVGVVSCIFGIGYIGIQVYQIENFINFFF